MEVLALELEGEIEGDLIGMQVATASEVSNYIQIWRNRQQSPSAYDRLMVTNPSPSLVLVTA